MTRDELKKRLDDIDIQVKAARARFFHRWRADLDKADWYRRALELVDAQGIDPLIALLQLERSSDDIDISDDSA
jgi:hypothetical protein